MKNIFVTIVALVLLFILSAQREPVVLLKYNDISKSAVSPQPGDIWCMRNCTHLYVETDTSSNHYVLVGYNKKKK